MRCWGKREPVGWASGPGRRKPTCEGPQMGGESTTWLRKQWFPKLSAPWNHPGNLKQSQCLGCSFRDCDVVELKKNKPVILSWDKFGNDLPSESEWVPEQGEAWRAGVGLPGCGVSLLSVGVPEVGCRQGDDPR